MNSTNETILNTFKPNHLFDMIRFFQSNDGDCNGFNIAYKGILGSPEITPYEELETLLRCIFVENGQFDSLDEVTIYDVISRFFPDYFHGTSYVELSKYIFNSVNRNFVIEGLKTVHWGDFPFVKVYDYEIFLNSFKQRYPEIHPDSMFGKVYEAYDSFIAINITGNTYMKSE